MVLSLSGVCEILQEQRPTGDDYGVPVCEVQDLSLTLEYGDEWRIPGAVELEEAGYVLSPLLERMQILV
jgi:hypothetical protein